MATKTYQISDEYCGYTYVAEVRVGPAGIDVVSLDIRPKAPDHLLWVISDLVSAEASLLQKEQEVGDEDPY